MSSPESGFLPERKKGLALALGILVGAGVLIDKCVDKLSDHGSGKPTKKEVKLSQEEIKDLRKGLDTARRVLGALVESTSFDEELPEVPRFDKLKISKDFLASFPNKDWLTELDESEAVHDLLREELNDYIVMKLLRENPELKKQFESFVERLVVEADENSIHVYNPDYEEFDSVLTLESGKVSDDELSYFVYDEEDVERFSPKLFMTENEYSTNPDYMRQGIRPCIQYEIQKFLSEQGKK